MGFAYFGDMNSGYDGYSMSKRAAESYEHGSMPKSKWTKAEILSHIENKSIREKLKKCRVDVLRDKVLQYDGWHHTSSYCNETSFYCIDETYVANLTDEDIDELIATPKPEKKVEEVTRYKANIYYAEWSGTRNHPKRIDKCLENVYIEERGSFFYVYDKKGKKTGKLILKKKIGSNYTSVTNLDKLAKKEES